MQICTMVYSLLKFIKVNRGLVPTNLKNKFKKNIYIFNFMTKSKREIKYC